MFNSDNNLKKKSKASIIGIIAIFILVAVFDTKAQYANDPAKIPDVIPKSPEVASLGRYGDIPVNLFTGTPDISIPLYTVKIGDIEVPITLNYNASGIQVDQEATIVGLGWNLIAGGNINYIPVGGDERLIYYPNNTDHNRWDQWQTIFDLDKGKYYGGGPFYPTQAYATGFFYKCGYLSYVIPDGWTSEEFAKARVDPDLAYWGVFKDVGEQDIYSFNILGRTFKYCRHPHTNDLIPTGQKTRDIVEFDGHNFTVTDGNGTKYNFEHKEEVLINGMQAINCWYLSRIQDTKGNFVQFSYDSFGSVYSIPTLSEVYIKLQPIESNFHTSHSMTQGPKRTIHTANREIRNLYLTSIVTNLDSVQFQYATGRTDLAGDGKRHLDKINVTSKISNQKVKVFKFDYDYFIGSKTGGNYLDDDDGDWHIDPMPNDASLSHRLKLTGLKELDPADETKKGDEYIFSYNESLPLPWKTSFSKDFWGYYNGEENSSGIMPQHARHTLIPDPVSYDQLDANGSMPQGLKGIKGANRSVSVKHTELGMLNSIIYPTGGMTEFKYESHISNSPYGGMTEGTKNLFSNVNISIIDFNKPNISNPVEEFTLKDSTIVTVNMYLNPHDYSIIDTYDTYIQLKKKNDNSLILFRRLFTDSSLINRSIKLGSGTYIFECNLNDNFEYQNSIELSKPIVYGNLTFTVKNELPPKYKENYGGGLRIKSVRNYDHNDKIVSEKRYTYSSKGIELKPVSYYSSLIYKYGEEYVSGQEIDGTPHYTKHFFLLNISTLYSDNIVRMPGIDVGSTVGYSKIEIENVSDGINNGKEISYFNNYNPTKVGSDRFFYVQSGLTKSGDLIKKVILNTENDTVKVDKFEYGEVNVRKQFLNVKFHDQYLGLESSGLIPRFSLLVYLNTSQFHHLKKKETYDYFEGKDLYNFTEYVYDTVNYCLDEVKEITSEGKIKSTKFKYPHDFAAGVYPNMVNLNQLSPVIETSNYNDGIFLNSIRTNYKLAGHVNGSSVFLPSNVSTKTLDNSDEERIIYDYYGIGGNILQYHKKDDINTSFYWAYNNLYPVAKIDGIAYNDIPSNVTGALDELDNTNLQDASLKSHNNTIRQGLTGKMVTTYTYKPSVGIKTVTDPNNKTTWYNYDNFNRLISIKDDKGKILKTYEYFLSPIVTPPSGFYCSQVNLQLIKLAWNTEPLGRNFRLYRLNTDEYSLVYSGTGTSYNDNEVSFNTEYRYKLTIVENGIESHGITLSVTTPSPIQTPVINSINKVAPTVFLISWNSVSIATGYELYRSYSENGAYNLIHKDTVNRLNYDDKSLQTNTWYWYKVKAYNEEYISNFSEPFSAKSFISQPENLTAIALSNNQIQLSWSDIEGEQSYKVFRNDVLISTLDPNDTIFTDTGLLANTEYRYKIQSYELGIPDYYFSSISCKTKKNPPSCVSSLSISKTVNQYAAYINISWADGQNEENYKIYRSTSASGTYNVLATIPANSTSYSDNTVSVNTTYYYKVEAVNSDNSSGISGYVSATLTSPVAAILSKLNTTTTSITINWGSTGDGSIFRLYKGTSLSDVTTLVAEIPANTNTYNITGLTANTTLYFKLETLNYLGTAISTIVSIKSGPAKPILNMSRSLVCANNVGLPYLINRVPEAVSYEWTVPSAFTILSQTDTSRVLQSGTNAGTYTIRVRAGNGSSYGDYLDIPVTILNPASVPSSPGTIIQTITMGGSTVYAGYQVTYSIAEVDGAMSYNWTIPSGWTLKQGSGTNVIVVDAGSNSGNVTVKAVNCKGESVASSIYVNVVLPIQTPGISSIIKISPTALLINWNSVSSATGYELYCSNSENGTYNLIYNGNSLNFENGSLLPNTWHWYKLKAYNESYKTGFSSILSAKTFITQPQNLTATVLSNSQVQLSWSDVEGEQSYKVFRNGSVIATLNSNTAYTDAGLSGNTNYSYKVQAYETDLSDVYFSSISCTTKKNPPTSVSGLSISKTVNQYVAYINISWADGQNEESYKIYRATSASGTYNVLATISANSTSYSDNTASVNTTYYYKVEAVNSDYSSGLSGYVSATLIPPVSAVLTQGTTTTTSIWINWGSTGDGSIFRLYKGTSSSDVTTLVTEIPANTNTYNVTDLTVNTTWYFKLETVNYLGTVTSAVISCNLAPSKPILSFGALYICPNYMGLLYRVNSIPGATVYEWTVPAGYTILQQNNNELVIKSGTANGTIRVRVSNGSVYSDYLDINLTITNSIPPTPGTIIQTITGGGSTVRPGSQVTYSIAEVTGATSYQWTLPSGWTLKYGSGSNAIVVDAGSISGNVSVRAINCKGASGASSKYVTVVP